MPKARFTLSDVAAMRREVWASCGDWRVQQVYDGGDGRSFVFKLHAGAEGGGKRLLVLESGTRFLVSKYDAREPTTTPSPLCGKMRQTARGKRLTDVAALGGDRVVAFRFGAGATACHVVLELYAAGNVVLADADFRVVAALRVAPPAVRPGGAYPSARAAGGGTVDRVKMYL